MGPTDDAQIREQSRLLEEELAAPIELPTPSAAPAFAAISGPNTRVRAGNAMQRARAAAISGAIAVLAKQGVKNMTMGDVADAGGLARATLYNHVRDKESLLLLVMAHEARELAKVFSSAATLPEALTATARMIADHPALIGVRNHDPLALAAIAVPATGEGWTAIRELTRQALAVRGGKATDAQIDLLLRWLTSFITFPTDDASRNAQASELAKSLQ